MKSESIFAILSSIETSIIEIYIDLFIERITMDSTTSKETKPKRQTASTIYMIFETQEQGRKGKKRTNPAIEAGCYVSAPDASSLAVKRCIDAS